MPQQPNAQVRLAAIVDSSDDAIISKDASGTITSWNAAAERLFGYTAAEAVGQPIRLIIPPELFAEEDDVLERIKGGEAVDHYETVRLAKDGRRLDLALAVSALKDASGRVVGASTIARDIGERKRLERMQRDAWHLAAIVDSSDDAIVSKDLDSTVLTWNAAAERLFGFSSADIVGRSIRLLIPDDRQGEEDDVLARVRLGERVEHYETVRRRKDGTLVPVSLTVSPIRDATGTIVGASKIARDVTEKTRADETARRLASIVESSDDAIVSKGLDGIIMSWNPAAERMFGYTAAEVIGRSIRILIPPELQSEEDVVLAKLRAGERVDHFETRRQRKDGTTVFVSLTVSPIRDGSGRIIGASKVARDVTERVRLEATAREHAANTEALGQIGAIVASTLERDAIMQQVVELATGLTRAELGVFFHHDPDSGGAHMRYAAAPGYLDALEAFKGTPALERLQAGMRSDRSIRIDDTTDALREEDSPCFQLSDALPARSCLAVPVKGRSGGGIGALFFGHSRPGAFGAQEERLAAGVAAWASVALENARLFSEAQKANRLKDEFLAVLSHELRTPLNAIVGYARLLSGGVLSADKASRGLMILERNATWLTQIVEDVLDVSRIVSGKIRLDIQPVELGLVVDNAATTVQPAADAKGIRVQTMVDPQIGPVSGDPGRLQQVTWNLLSNAVKFTPKGGRVQIRVERANSHVEIIVSDTGAGIHADFLPYVFDRFRQADAGTTRHTGGLGLGLAIVRHIVEMHGGSVEAESPGEGLGATFTVRLPLMIVHPRRVDAPREHPRSERRAPQLELADLRGVRVLAVDDEEDALSLLREALEAAGAEVTTLGSSAHALERLEAVLPDVLVLDLGMPDMDGFELIARIRRSSNLAIRNVPAAALTAFARSEDRTRALRSGFEMHLAKPVDPGELVASVAMLAKRGRRAT